MGFNLPVLNRRRRLLGTATFSPSALFALAEPGVWYDPSDVANLNWRRNLLTWTEQFDNAAWTNVVTGAGVAPTITANAGNAPNSTATADRIQFSLGGGTASGDISRKAQAITTPAITHVFSVYIRSNDGVSSYNMHIVGPTGNTTNIVVTGTWQRFEISGTGTGGNVNYAVGLRGGQTPANSNTADVLVWGAQLELGSTATDYQRISDVNTEVIERFPTATLYQDTAGTQPVTTPGQTVALALDKSKGLVLGSELVTNGDFASGTTSGFTQTSGNVGTSSVISGELNVVAGGSGSGGFYQDITVTQGATYLLTVKGRRIAGAGSVRFQAYDGAAFTTLIRQFFDITTTGAQTSYSAYVRTTSTTTIRVYLYADTSTTGGFDDVSLKLLPGFHATQATAASRPTYGIVPATGRRNLLTFTEQFDNAAWTKTATNVTANAAVAPDGTTTADTATAISTSNAINNAGLTLTAAAHTLSVYLKAGSLQSVRLGLVTAGFGLGATCIFNLSNGSASAVTQYGTTSGSTASIQDVGSGWYRCSVTVTTTATTWFFQSDVTGSTGSYLIWGAQLETGSSATAYQRVGSAFDVTEAGVASLSYLSFDGVDDFLVSSTVDPTTGPAGPELVTNGDFSGGTTGWTGGFNFGGNATFAAVGGVGRLSVTAAGPVSPRVVQTLTGLTVGNTYRISIQVVAASGSGDVFSAWTSVSDGTGGTTLFQVTPVSAPGTRTFFVQASATTMYLALGRASGTSGAVLDLDNISVKVSAADKAQVFAGVRKLSDAAGHIAGGNGNISGHWEILSSGWASASSRYGAGFYTNVLAQIDSPPNFTPPRTDVLSWRFDTSGATGPDKAKLNVNGVAQTLTIAGLPTGANFGAFVHYIGRREGTSLPFNGNIFSLIVRFGANLDANTITNTEVWVGGKTQDMFAPVITGVPTIGVA